MKIEKKDNSMTKVTFSRGDYNLIPGGKDPIDETIDINLLQKKFANELLVKFQEDGRLKHMAFLQVLSNAYSVDAWNSPEDNQMYYMAINSYNYAISVQRTERCSNGLDWSDINKSATNTKTLKYQMAFEDGTPQFIMQSPETIQEYTEQLIACILLDFVYQLIDLRKIEEEIPELKGLCQCLKELAPDEFNGFCSLADVINFDTELDIEGYHKILKRIKSSA